MLSLKSADYIISDLDNLLQFPRQQLYIYTTLNKHLNKYQPLLNILYSLILHFY